MFIYHMPLGLPSQRLGKIWNIYYIYKMTHLVVSLISTCQLTPPSTSVLHISQTLSKSLPWPIDYPIPFPPPEFPKFPFFPSLCSFGGNGNWFSVEFKFTRWLIWLCTILFKPSSSLRFNFSMATLLRKVWGSVSTRSGLHLDMPSTVQEPLLGDFDRIPMEILMQILQLAGPKTTAKMGMLCKSWRSLVSDNNLWIFFLQNQLEPWDSVLFGETKLASGYPIE